MLRKNCFIGKLRASFFRFHHVFHHGDQRKHIVVMLLYKHSVSFLEQPFGQLVNDWYHDSFMLAQHGGHVVYTACHLIIQAAAVTVAAADDGTSLTLLFFQFIAFKQLRTLFLIDSAHDIPDRELSVSHKLGTGIEEAVRGDGYLFSPQLTPFVAVLFSLYMAGYLHLKGAKIKFLLPLRQFIVKISQFPVLAS